MWVESLPTRVEEDKRIRFGFRRRAESGEGPLSFLVDVALHPPFTAPAERAVAGGAGGGGGGRLVRCIGLPKQGGWIFCFAASPR